MDSFPRETQSRTDGTFPEALRFNVDYGIFEVVNDAPQLLEKQLKKILQNQQPRNPIYDVVRKRRQDVEPVQMNVPCEDKTINVNYNIMCLNREQGIKWIKKERLPAFLESDCYFEYRLAKLVSQVRWSKSGVSFTIGTHFSPWVLRKPRSPPPPAVEEDNLIIMKKFYISLGEASYTQTKDWFSLAKQSQQMTSTFSLPCCVPHSKIESPVISSVSESSIFDDGVHPRTKKGSSTTTKLISELEEGSVSLKDTPSRALLRIYLEKQYDVFDRSLTLHFSTCEEFLNSYIFFILREAVQKITGEPLKESPNYINFSNVGQVVVNDTFESLLEPVHTIMAKSEDALEKNNLSSKRDSFGPESRTDWNISHRTYNISNRKEFENFKKFMKGTLGERYWYLWMDIERLKVLKDPGRHQRAPRFCITHLSSTKSASAELKFWHLRQEKPRKDIDPFPQMATLLPLRPKSCNPQISEIQKEEFISVQHTKSLKKTPRVKTAAQKLWKTESLCVAPSRDPGTERGTRHLSESSRIIRLISFTDISECLKPQLDRRYTYTEEPKVKTMSDVGAFGGFHMENLLQSLYVESRAGFFFTKFCEDSGNKLWKNSVYFWFDLQAYHQLFYQETLQPFKVCKQAQYLFATYVAPSATLDIGLQQEKKKEICMKIHPPFEDLFDTAEEYILLLLLEPWMKMVKSDQFAYRKVEQVEESRQLDSTCLRKLQALYKESFPKKTEDATGQIGTGILSLSDVSKQTEYWNNVPEEYKHFSFNDLLNNKLEFEHFCQFLGAHSSSMDLMCWTDIEQFRRINYRDRNQREAKSIYIKNKYLNKKYFFGPNSPASLNQQNEVVELSGGWGKILHEQLDAPVLIEIQKHVLNRLENVWLPLFLASEQFAARQKIKVQMKDIAGDLLLQKHEGKIGVWKASNCYILPLVWLAPSAHRRLGAPVLGLQPLAPGRLRSKMLRHTLESRDAQTRQLQDAVTNVEKHFGEPCQIFAAYVRKTARLRDKADLLVNEINMYTSTESPDLKQDLKIFADEFAKLQDYQQAEVERLEAKVVEPLKAYGAIVKLKRDDLKAALTARNREAKQLTQLERTRQRNPSDRQPVESKWISSSCEIITFRKALLNPVTAKQFQHFVTLKGDLLGNGVLFWQEVQKYKDLCHSHCDESAIQKKITTVISCFINSCIPPALQIDIPVEQAQKIIEHRKELGPYIFREAQMTILGVLFKFWPQFCEFRKNLTDEKIMSVLERRQAYEKQKKKLSVIDDEKIGKVAIKQYASTTGSTTKTPALTSESLLGLQAYGRQPTWCYSKYIEALEQERILLKIQELERKLLTGTPSFTHFFKSSGSVMSLKKNLSTQSIQSEFPASS
ncbi:Regulator of G-protein signaling 22 [Heterocephalus glaber]|uniref:Regulator of G-protein signaling 22 n=1 Tax=Heterocephalus glaber TaxID=10181 RepID=G5ANZ1_HETGA|nr:Regulator of G-protein signaling 22 [Heterocephalus glaber]